MCTARVRVNGIFFRACAERKVPRVKEMQISHSIKNAEYIKKSSALSSERIS